MGYYPNRCRHCKQTIYSNRDAGEPITEHESLEECIESLADCVRELQEKENN